MKKICFICFLAMCIVFSAAYTLSSRYAKEHPLLPSETTEWESALEETQKANTPLMPVIQSSTRFVLEVYYTNEGLLSEKEQVLPSTFVGLGREELQEVLDQQNMASFEEVAYDQTYRYELISFNESEVRIREVISPNPEFYECFVIAEGDYVNIYTADRSDIYLDTILPVEEFSSEVAFQLRNGIYMKTILDLYDFLQNYTS